MMLASFALALVAISGAPTLRASVEAPELPREIDPVREIVFSRAPLPSLDPSLPPLDLPRAQAPASADRLSPFAQSASSGGPAGLKWPFPALTPDARNVFGALGFAALAALLLYHRIEGPAVLTHERRQALMQAIRAEPGIARMDLARRVGLAWGTLLHHLDRLEDAGMVTSLEVGNQRAYYATGAVPTEARPAFALLRTGVHDELARFVLTRPGSSLKDVCETLGLAPSHATKALARLEAAGLVDRAREGGRSRVSPTPLLANVLAS